jgi:hypothetical protein
MLKRFSAEKSAFLAERTTFHRVKGAQAWDIRLRGFCTNQTYMDRW